MCELAALGATNGTLPLAPIAGPFGPDSQTHPSSFIPLTFACRMHPTATFTEEARCAYVNGCG